MTEPKLLSFLGTGNYKPTTYFLNGKGEYLTDFAPVALAHILRPAQTCIFLTSAAREKHWERISSQWPADGLSLEPVHIPDGASEGEMWQIFNILTEQVQEGDQLIFDITHSYRSLPFLSFLALSFLRVARAARVAGVYYGAYEARDKDTDRTPIFDLTPFVDLLDWTIAADLFIRFGDAQDLAGLASATKDKWRRGEAFNGRVIGPLGEIAGCMQDLSLALRLIRPEEALGAAAKLEHAAEKWSGVDNAGAEIAPFSLLIDAIREDYARFALQDPRSAPAEDLRRQKALLRWYLDHQQYAQTLALAREWFVSWAMLSLHMGEDLYNREARGEVEKILNEACKKLQENTPLDPPLEQEQLKLWTKLTNARNDMLHAGMREDYTKAPRLQKNITALVEELEALPLPEAAP